MLSWMAWTVPTALFFLLVFSSIAILIIVEIKFPGGNERKGILGLVTTRGDRLFISFLGSAYIFLFWLGVFGTPLYLPLILAIIFTIFCFKKI